MNGSAVETTNLKSTRLAIVVGINEYHHDPLRFAVNDASEIASILSQPEYRFDTRVLLNEEVTRTAILTEFDNARADPPEILLFYFSGHGYVTDWKRSFLVTAGAERVDEGFDLQHLAQLLQMQPPPTTTAIALLDCCHAGAAMAWNTARPIDPESVDSAIRGYSETRAVFAACRPEQDALSAVSSPHGAFTHYLLEGLTGAAANYQGEVTIDDLVTFVRRRMDNASQLTVYRCDSAGSVKLGAGLAPVGTEPLSANESAEIAAEAKRLLAEYQQHITRGADDWLATGYSDCCSALRPILRRFESVSAKHSELKNNKDFVEERRRLQSKLAHIQNLEPGLVVDGYKVVESLGAGGFGTVWLLRESRRRRGKPVALKVFNPNDLGNQIMRAMFDRGYRAMEQLNHERIVKVRGKSAAPLGFYMDYVEGRNLRTMAPPTDDPRLGLRILVLAGETIKHAHDKGVVHRDIKPENLLVVLKADGTWLPFLTDFDLAWFSTASKLASQAMASLSYGAPEYLQAPLSEAAHRMTVDTYSFIQLAYYIMTGSDPVAFQAERNTEVLRKRLAHWRVGGVAQRFLDLYMRCSMSDPRQRPDDFAEIIEELVSMESMLATSDATVLPRDTLLAELAYSLCGLPGSDVKYAPSSYWSVSGQTQIDVSITGEKRDGKKVFYDLRARLALQQIAMSQESNVKARAALNSRVDNALKGYEGASKDYGSSGAYAVYINLPGVSDRMEGVRYARSALADVIGAIERG
jgi:serine/threonine protein kinase